MLHLPQLILCNIVVDMAQAWVSHASAASAMTRALPGCQLLLDISIRACLFKLTSAATGHAELCESVAPKTGSVECLATCLKLNAA